VPAVGRTGHGGAERKGTLGYGDPSGFAVSRDRLQAWGRQLRLVHQELRAQADSIREAIQRGDAGTGLSAELALFCHGFCGALTGHHVAEDERLFPRVLDAHPGLAAVTARLTEDHRLLSALIKDLDHVSRTAGTDEVLRHLDGISAIMESHFRYEERELTRVLDSMTAREPDIRSLL
jgi:Hemerythrin HHE cation binding domain